MKRFPGPSQCLALFLSLLLWGGLSIIASPPLKAWQEEPQKEENPTEKKEDNKPSDNQRAGPRRGGERDEGGIKPYDKVITEEAESDEGLFTVHKIKEKYYYEIPESELDRELLWVSRIAKTTRGVGYGGQKLGTRVVRWQRRGDKILLRNVSYSIVADKDLPIAKAVESANNDTIIQVFPIRALGPDGAPVIEVTPLYNAEVAEFSARSRLQARAMDKKRSFVDEILSFPRNIEVRATHTYTKPPANNRTPGRPQPQTRRRGMPSGSATLLLHFSMLKLPEEPMMPRLYDERVGYFSMRQTDFGRQEHKAVQRRFITRWRLEKKDPAAQLSEPVQPIVYWIDPATPQKWVPYVKKGVEKWQAAFEAAGFKKAIIASEAPSPDVDPEWHPEDARYSVIRWLPSDVENASGPHVHDPRTGEILESDIQFYHNVQNLLRSWYFLQVAPLDPRAQKLPFPDDLMGVLLEYVVAHEVGHTLGFRHNMKASSTYPLEKVRDPQWVATMSHTPTLMDYSRFNYVAQPEDGIPVEDLIPKIGPYDIWATMWGYKPIPEASSADEEKETLDRWIREQDKKPWLRFSTAGARGSDPGDLTEAVGDADAVQATALGLKNLERVADLLLEASAKPGENWDDLEELYGRLLGQWVREMVHVTALVGGFHSQQKHAGQQGVRFEPVPRQRQAEAVSFLSRNAFGKPQFLIRPEILRRIEPSGVLSRIGNSQRRVLSSLLSSARFTRLAEQEALGGTAAYSPAQFMEDLRQGIWGEIYSKSPSIDAFRRNLQRHYLGLVNSRLNGQNAGGGEMRSFLRGDLRSIDRQIAAGLSSVDNAATRVHLEDVRDQIARILDPKFAPARSALPTRPGIGLDERDWDESDPEELHCWPDLIIRPY